MDTGGYPSYGASNPSYGAATASPPMSYPYPPFGDQGAYNQAGATAPPMPTGTVPPMMDGSGDPPPYVFPTDGAPPSAPPEGINGGYNYGILPNYDDQESAPDVPPPPYEPPTTEKQDQTFSGMTFITASEVKNAVIEASEAKCCYGNTPARELETGAMTSASALHYGLESFTESRKTSWKQEPYVGQPIDSPMYGPSPEPWSIPVQPLAMFRDEKRVMEIPRTAYVTICMMCHGWGRKRCFSCHGRGHDRCISCNGSGETGMGDTTSRCVSCSGSGSKRCFSCHGSGFTNCLTCQGMGRIKRYVQLTVKFETQDDDHVIQSIELEFPDKLVKKGSGVTLFEQMYPRVQPIFSHPSQELNMKSQELVQRHLTKYNDKRILMQKHWLRGVPITKSACVWKEKSFDVWVYGDNHLVYMPDYPQKCCCGCAIL